MRERLGNKKRGNLLWLLVLLAVILVWVFFRPGEGTNDGASPAEIEADYLAAFGADPDDILVDLRDDIAPEAVERIERELGIDLELVSDQARDEQFYRAHVPASRQAEILAALQAMPSVELAEPDAIYSVGPGAEVARFDAEPEWAGFPNDPKYKFQWHLDQIKMPAAWKLSAGDDVVVAVLDTGVAYEQFQRFHMVEDLDGVEFVKSFDFVANNEHANDDHGHGTHVAGTIAQATHNGIGVAGVARNVKIMPLKVLSGSGSGSVGGIADAIRYAADEGAHVINMSLGGPFPSRALAKAVAYAHSKGVVVVCAAGNDGRGKLGYPAGYPGAVAVAATQYDESTTFYSNFGKNLDIAAPGGNVRVDQNGDGMPDGVLQNTIAIGDPTRSDYFGFMGTSMAAPHVAGVAALVVSEGITNPDAVEKILQDTAMQPAQYSEKHYGAGIVDAEAAVLKARTSTGGWQLLLGGLLAGALALGVGARRLGIGYAAGAVFGASGLFFLPHVLPSLSSWPVVETLTRGLPSWGMGFLGVEYANALLFSAAAPVALVLVLFGIRRARPLLAGIAAGVAGHLLFHAATGVTDIRWMVADPLWLLANAALCIGLGALVLRSRRDA